MNNQTTPEWLHTALAQSAKSYKLQWIESNDLPPITVGQYCLNNHQVTQLLFALKQSNFDRPHAFVTALKRHCNPTVLDAFVWDLCDRWLQIGADAKDKWALIAVGLLGTDTSVLKLARLIPAWRSGGHHQRAVLGLQCLRSIGTDTALMQINQIAQNRRLKALQAKAKECMEAIAKNRGLTPEQLEDRIVPDCGLDARGCRVFDYGSRQFNLVLADQMKPRVRDSEGKLRLNLPKPKANDDAELASSAMQAWNLLKKQLSEVIKTQSKRLERAMIERRTWQRQEFESFLVRHPLMGNLVRSLIWAAYDNSGHLVATFRITEDQTYADADDESLDLEGITHVGIVHPAQLSQNLRATWGEVMSDYEIMALFRQLSRTVFSLEPEEYQSLKITRFQGISISSITLAGILEGTGWQQGTSYCKPFPRANVTAVLECSTDANAYMDRAVELKRCFFIPGLFPQVKPHYENAMQLGDVDAVVISEVLRNLGAVASKGNS